MAGRRRAAGQNCLFANQAGELLKVLTEDYDLHTVVRLPRCTFASGSQGVNASVVCFTSGAPTRTEWVYDDRANVPGITKKVRPLTAPTNPLLPCALAVRAPPATAPPSRIAPASRRALRQRDGTRSL